MYQGVQVPHQISHLNIRSLVALVLHLLKLRPDLRNLSAQLCDGWAEQCGQAAVVERAEFTIWRPWLCHRATNDIVDPARRQR